MTNPKKLNISFLIGFIFLLIPFAISADGKQQSSEVVVDDFSKVKSIGDFPIRWKTYPFQSGKVKQVYKIAEEKGVRYIHAVDEQDISLPIYKDISWSLKEYPVVKWRWRGLDLPVGAREDSRATNDSACGVYVIFGSMSNGSVLKYVWSSTLPVGHVWEKEPGKFYVTVLASGSKSLNKWQSMTANVYEDYKKYFKKEPTKNPSGIGILTDGNAMHSKAACDYGDFSLSTNP